MSDAASDGPTGPRGNRAIFILAGVGHSLFVAANGTWVAMWLFISVVFHDHGMTTKTAYSMPADVLGGVLFVGLGVVLAILYFMRHRWAVYALLVFHGLVLVVGGILAYEAHITYGAELAAFVAQGDGVLGPRPNSGMRDLYLGRLVFPACVIGLLMALSRR